MHQNTHHRTLFSWAPRSASLLLGALLPALVGCQGLIINSQAKLIRDASPAAQNHWDLELVGDAIPYSIVQLEGLVSLSPDNDILLGELARLYTSYAYGWIEDEIDATPSHHFERRASLERRARHLHLRARHYALRLAQSRESEFPDPRSLRLDALKERLVTDFTDPEDAKALFWLGFSWGAAINVSRDDVTMLADLGHARAVVERSRELDPEFYQGGATNFIATVSCSLSPAMGGNVEEGKALFEELLAAGERKNLMVHYNYARTCAVQTQDRALFESLLREVIDAPDLGNGTRLQNKIARRRARRMLARGNQLFL